MKFKLKASVLISIATSTGFVVLLGYFVKAVYLVNIRILFLRWAVILSAVALLVGIVNLVRVHWKKIKERQKGSFYSLIMLGSLFATLVVVGYWGPAGSWSLWIYNYIQIPIESSLMAILAVLLVVAIVRLLRRRLSVFSLVFVGTAVFVLLGTTSLLGFDIPGLHELRSWILQVWSVAGARGILLGVALGTIATGLRVLIGTDRPYGD